MSIYNQPKQPGTTLHQRQHSNARETGFSLVELSIVIAIASILIVFGVTTLSVQLESASIRSTLERQKLIQDALVAYLGANKRLPCPDTDFTAPDGVENRATPGNPATACSDPNSTSRAWGLIPYATLGIPKEATLDGWSNHFTYAVSRTATANTDWTLTANFYAGNVGDLNIKTRATSSGTSSDVTTKAVVVIVSHGKNGFGAYTKGGTRNELPVTGTDEYDNTDGGISSGDKIYFKRDRTDVETGSGAFDDIVFYIEGTEFFARLTQDGTIKSPYGALATQFEKIKLAMYGWMLINVNARGGTACGTTGTPRCRRLITQDTDSDGVENGTATTANGTIPYTPLGLSTADVTDPWGSRIQYTAGSAAYAGATASMILSTNGNGIGSGYPTVGNFPPDTAAITLTSLGPDRTLSTSDDIVYSVTLNELRGFLSAGAYIP